MRNSRFDDIRGFRDPHLVAPELKQPAAVWAARLLLAGGKKFRREKGMDDEDVLKILDMGYLEDKFRRHDGDEATDLLVRKCQELADSEAKLPESLLQNLRRLKEWLKLSPVEAEILAILALTHTLRDLGDLFDSFAEMAFDGTVRALAEATGRPLAEVDGAFSTDRLLETLRVRQGDDVFRGGPSVVFLQQLLVALLDCKWDASRITDLIGEPMELEGDGFTSPVGRGWSARESAAVIESVGTPLAKGGHVLITGPSGVGKTELAKAVASATGRMLFAVSTRETDSGECKGAYSVLSGSERLMSYQRMRRIRDYYQGGTPIFLFDDAETVLSEAEYSVSGSGGRGLVKSLLDQRVNATIWVCDDGVQMHPSVRRRFDHVATIPLNGHTEASG